MRKKIAIGLLSSSLLLPFVASAAEFKVIGKITPASCTPAFTGGGVISYGNIAASTLNAATQTALPDMTSSLTITCDAPVKFGVTVVDNRAATAVPSLNTVAGYTAANKFGLGSASGQNIGTYSLQLSSPTADTGATNLLSSPDSGVTWAVSNGAVANNTMIGFGDSTSSTAAAAHKSMNVSVRVVAAIAPANTLSFTNAVKIDGSTTFQVNYL